MMQQINAENTNFDVIVALDALAQGTIVASLMVGLPATVALGSDRYAAKIVRTTAKTIIVERQKGESVTRWTFRNTPKGWRSGKHYRLLIGQAEDYSPREEMGY